MRWDEKPLPLCFSKAFNGLKIILIVLYSLTLGKQFFPRKPNFFASLTIFAFNGNLRGVEFVHWVQSGGQKVAIAIASAPLSRART
jgi:hypothetical protein